MVEIKISTSTVNNINIYIHTFVFYIYTHTIYISHTKNLVTKIILNLIKIVNAHI